MSDGSDTRAMYGDDFEDVDSSSERESETKRHGIADHVRFSSQDDRIDENSWSRSSSQSSGRQHSAYQPYSPGLDSGTYTESMERMNYWSNPKIAHSVGTSVQPPVLTTTSQDLTEGLQHKIDDDLGSFALKFGLLASPTSTSHVDVLPNSEERSFGGATSPAETMRIRRQMMSYQQNQVQTQAQQNQTMPYMQQQMLKLHSQALHRMRQMDDMGLPAQRHDIPLRVKSPVSLLTQSQSTSSVTTPVPVRQRGARTPRSRPV
ncbi:hypothetical protein IWX90DRAFT_214161 [Phyllosticta citrichinensis]|uniref:Uncharacterized protein n=1 Tax=Phyllosticta citrichinensis TaxID=1130410 RepID=A0ABR1XTA7_9PEZI